jgi:hypothetical protein
MFSSTSILGTSAPKSKESEYEREIIMDTNGTWCEAGSLE